MLFIKIKEPIEIEFSNSKNSRKNIKDFLNYIEKMDNKILKKQFYDAIDNYHNSLLDPKKNKKTLIYLDLVKNYTNNLDNENIKQELQTNYLIEKTKEISNSIGKSLPAEYKDIFLTNQKTILINLNYSNKDHKKNLEKIFKDVKEFEIFETEKETTKKLNKNEINNQYLFLKNTIFFGPPGTGKSYYVKEITEKAKTYRVTFHPEYTYSDFLGQYKPVIGYHSSSHSTLDREIYEINGKEIKGKKPVVLYDFVPGIFTKALLEAFKNPEENVYLIIEEINRGNCAAIFGDIFQLLDKNKDSNESEFPIDLPVELLDYICNINLDNDKINSILNSQKLSLPNNFFILATMNTSDQSLFPMDSAFKRRWNMHYIPINYKENSLIETYFKINNQKYNWLEFLKWINDLIEKTNNAEDKQIGQWFLKIDEIDENNCKFFNEQNFKNKVLSYLFFDVFKFERSKIFKHSSFSKIIECDSLEDIFNDY